MTNCVLGLVPLSCDRTGVGFTAKPLDSESNRLHLVKGHTKHFPNLEGGQYFYVRIKGCEGCCEVAKVTGIEEDVLILDRTAGSKCTCITSNTMVSYVWDDIRVVTDIAKSIGINVESPLRYDACTRTLSVDCKALFAADCGGCGCGEGVQPTLLTGEQPAGGLRGEQGDKGDQGVGVSSFTISPSGQLMYTLTDGTTRSAGVLPVAKGVRGEPGPPGAQGAPGAKGDKGETIAAITAEPGIFKVVMSDNQIITVDATAMKGDKGDKGDPGDKGDTGPAGYSFQYVETATDAYVFGYPGVTFTIQSPAMPGVTLGPYTTGADGVVTIPKPPVSGSGLLTIKVNNTIVGIGRIG